MRNHQDPIGFFMSIGSSTLDVMLGAFAPEYMYRLYVHSLFFHLFFHFLFLLYILLPFALFLSISSLCFSAVQSKVTLWRLLHSVTCINIFCRCVTVVSPFNRIYVCLQILKFIGMLRQTKWGSPFLIM